MDDSSMTFTTLALFVLLVIMLVLFGWHFLGPRATMWLRSNKEEKIGLSKNNLFQASGYTLHSGSEFLLSQTGSFKRFDTIDRDAHQRQRQLQQQPQLVFQHSNSPLWNISEEDIPPPPQRAPPQVPTSAGSHTKTVTFSFTQLDEMPQSAGVPSNGQHRYQVPNTGLGHGRDCEEPAYGPLGDAQISLVSCMKTPSAMNGMPATTNRFFPQPIGMPPPARLAASSSVTALSTTAIPRPLAKRQISLQNGHTKHAAMNGHAKPAHVAGTNKMLQRRNSSTNPFLCESADSTDSGDQPDGPPNDHNETYNALSPTTMEDSADGQPTPTSNGNPFYTDADGPLSQPRAQPLANGHASRPPVPRQRSHSETDTPQFDGDQKTFTARLANASDGLLKLSAAAQTNPFAGLTHHMKGPHLLQKTISEDFLFHKKGAGQGHNIAAGIAGRSNASNGTWSFGRSLLRQDSTRSLGRRNSSLDASLGASMDSINLEHGVSCESVNSDASNTSMFFSDAGSQQSASAAAYTQITGYLCVGLHYDMNSITDEGMELTVSVLEAKGLMYPVSVAALDTFVRIYLVPDQAVAMQTQVFHNSITPNYSESFNFWLKKHQGRHSLWFHLYHNGEAHTLIGEAEMEISEVPCPITTWIPLSDSRKCNAQWGELMFSLSYLPTAERLTIVIVKGRNLKMEVPAEGSDRVLPVQSLFVKVYLMNNEKKVLKKRTSLKRRDHGPIFNEAMIFSVPPHGLTTVQLRLSVFGVVSGADQSLQGMNIVPLGHVIAGSSSTGKGLRHWHQMLSSLRKPVAMWHVLRRATNQPIFTGGAEAVVAAMQSTQMLRTKRNSIF